MKEEKSPSFFNSEEVVTVLDYVKQILDMKPAVRLQRTF
jgi:hypothetical protein